MKLNVDLSSLKEKVNGVVLVVVLVVILIALLGFGTYYTVNEGINTSEKISEVKSQYANNIKLVGDLNVLKNNSDFYVAQKEKYDKVIADSSDYSVKNYLITLDDMCRKYDLDIKEIEVGEMVSMGDVSAARTTLSVVGKESDVRSMAIEILSNEKITRIDDFAIAPAEDDNVEAALTIVNFGK